MREFIVRRFSVTGVPEFELHKIEAENEMDAAKKICGTQLTRNVRAKPYRRADVRTVHTMNEHNFFYAAED